MSGSPSRWPRVLRRGGTFLVIGALAFVIDAAVFNLLAFGVTGEGVMYGQPVLAKAIAIAVATVFTYAGNRYWTYRSRRIERRMSRYVLFVAVNAAAIGIQLGCLAFSRYVLGLEGIVPDNIAGTFVGQALATGFRFFAYDRWIFREHQSA